ncbi:hypothetical protein GO984_03180 [Rhodobacteraceae bacterium CY05]|uniref:Holin n=1 Tax=Parasedimentitalea huanghaiensis TaxID=2682100 RepID=A0A6L6WAI1_9RHOB|nr:hypothetical protein [Zongyanglinia huanghaiensis]
MGQSCRGCSMIDSKLQGLANFTTISGAAIAGVGALSLTQWLAIGGFVLALAGFGVNFWFKVATYRLQRRELQAKLAGKLPS